MIDAGPLKTFICVLRRTHYRFAPHVEGCVYEDRDAAEFFELLQYFMEEMVLFFRDGLHPPGSVNVGDRRYDIFLILLHRIHHVHVRDRHVYIKIFFRLLQRNGGGERPERFPVLDLFV